MSSYKQDQSFARDVFGGTLETVLDWIVDNLEPEDVFPVITLEDWAEKSGYIKREKTNAKILRP